MRPSIVSTLSIAAGYASAALAVTVATALNWVVFGHERPTDVVMIYLLGVVVVAMRFGYGPSLLVTAASVAAYDFFFVEPYFHFTVRDPRQLLTFAIMLFVAVVISNLTDRVRRKAAEQVVLAVERGRLAEEAQRAQLQVKADQLRNALLRSVSHDLRTPLAVVQGAATALLDSWDTLLSEQRREFLETIDAESQRLNRLVRNLLDMTVLEAGVLQLNKEWQSAEEAIGVALGHLERRLGDRPIEIDVPYDLPLAPFDAILIGQALINLIENAMNNSPAGTPITVTARRTAAGIEIAVADRGPGIRPGDEERIFEKFFRGNPRQKGMGLGLAICRGIVAAHGGTVAGENRPGGGALFRFTLPVEGQPGKLPEGEVEVTAPQPSG
jgi:K+-sensing histidine kinase KdpD